MKKIIFISLIFIIFILSYSANSQNDSTYNTIKIKINPIQAAIFSEYAINTEYTFAKQYGIDFKAGYIYLSNDLFYFRHYPDKGLIFQIGFKKYYNAFSRKKRKINQYTGIWLLKRDMYKYYLPDGYNPDGYKHYYNAGTLKALIGSETFYKNFILDFYFGFGIRLKSIKHPYKSDENGQEFVPTLHLGMNIGFNIPVKK